MNAKTSPNDLLRRLRIERGWSQQRVADLLENIGGAADSKLVGKWERGKHKPSPFYQERLCQLYGCSASQLGFYPPEESPEEMGQVLQRRQKRETILQEAQLTHEIIQPVAEGMLGTIQNLEQEGIDMNLSRRFFLQMLGVAGVALVTLHKDRPTFGDKQNEIVDISTSTIENLADMTQHYRSLQRAGFATEDALRNHISLIQNGLENTVNNKYRRDLWRIQAQSLLLARHSITRKRELGRARTWNESAISSAQYSGDAFLLGAALGHLGHLYLTWQHDPLFARQLIEQAKVYTRGHPVTGWFAIVSAAISALENNKEECIAAVDQATEIAHGLAQTTEFTDLYYTDFNIAGVGAFAGNCLLTVDEPEKALERLTAINLNALSEIRHASAFYDIACAYTSLGDLEATQTYAYRSIDKALATDRLYTIPRFIHLAQKIQE